MNHYTRVLSVLLALALSSSLCAVPAYAVEGESSSPPPVVGEAPAADRVVDNPGVDLKPSADITPQSKAAAPVEEAASLASVKPPVGVVRVQILQGLALNHEVEFTLLLQGAGGKNTKSLVLSPSEDEVMQKTVDFSGLEDGKYSLTVSAGGFVTYTQAIEVEKSQCLITLYTGETSFAESAAAHPGIIFYGDVTGDGIVDNVDVVTLVDAIDGDLSPDGALGCDLNEDGKVSLVDLQFLAESLGRDQVTSTIERSVPSGAVEAALSDGVEVEGDLTKLVGGGDSSVTLQASTSISEAAPLAIEFDFAKGSNETVTLGGMTVLSPQGSINAISQGVVRVDYADAGGNDAFIDVPIASVQSQGMRARSAFSPTATIGSDGTITVNFGGQIAVKKITLTISETSNKGNLAEISKVEFLNDMESKIPPPQMDIPQDLTGIAKSKGFSVSWSPSLNVTGYELSVTSGGKEEVKRTTATSAVFSAFNNDKIKNGTEFVIKVQSVNGTWRSGWSDAITVIPKTDKVPDAPEGVGVKESYQALNVSWKNMEDTDSYNLFYREKGTEAYVSVEGIVGTSYQIAKLKDNTEYQVYLTGVNELGESGRSATATGRTVNIKPAQLPAYKLVNTVNESGFYLQGISSASYGRGAMVDSPLDSASGVVKSALGLFDNNYASHLVVEDWDEGGAYPGGEKGISATFDQPTTLGMISFAEVEDRGTYGYINVQYSDDKGSWKTVAAKVSSRTCENGRKYTLVRLSSSIVAKSVKIGIGRADHGVRNIVVAEMRFHGFDSLEADIMALYVDDLHLTLNDTVSLETINELQARLDTVDAASKEFHPYRSSLQEELTAARKLLETKDLQDVVDVHVGISAARDNRNLGISGLNAWQPLGTVAAAGDELVIYAGSPGKSAGSDAPLRLVVTQQHPESSAVAKVVATLKTGRNEVSIPKLSSTDVEKGGQLYIEYTNSNDRDVWSVRVSSVQSIPVLDLYKVSDEATRLQRVKDYLQKLDEFVPKLEERHNLLHRDGSNNNVNYAYRNTTCISNATDIQLDQMMYSVPAQQILASAGAGSNDERAVKLLASFDAMDQMMKLFYQHKGMTAAFEPGTSVEVVRANTVPYQHLNIRYTTMFAGAFMYAAGNHIGIEWGSVPGLGQGLPIVTDSDGGRIAGNYYGWGIAHEIGHNINQSQYSVVEVTNNYFAQLSGTDETNRTTRFSYDDVYKRVTSGDLGRSSDGAVQLAMYWQLRLAYDNSSAFVMHKTFQEAFQGRLFARIDSYARSPQTAPGETDNRLVLGSDKDQNLMRLASAAAERNLTEFFARWGLVPDAGTKTYIEQFDAETRAVYYVSDDARAYAREHEDTGAVAGEAVVQSSAKANGSEVTLSLSNTAAVPESVLGYEIARLTYSSGKIQREVVGFSTKETYVDNASFAGNRVVSYEVTAVDKFLNRSQVLVLDPIKITGDGLYSKNGWTATTNMTSKQDVVPPATDDDPDAPEPQMAINRVVDGDMNSTYEGVSSKVDPFFVIDMGKTTQLTSMRFAFADNASSIDSYLIEASNDGRTYFRLGEGKFSLSEDGSSTIYFNNGKDPWICTYDARYVRIVAPGQAGKTLSIKEVDIFGPSGDNVEFLPAGDGAAIGILDEDFIYEQGTDGKPSQFIPKGSVVFTGLYKGNPAYNVLVLFDKDGKIVGGRDSEGKVVSQQIILAPPPGNAMLGETSEGRWVYWIEPSADGAVPKLPTSVRSELFRVDNALTNEGQRLVSDTLFVDVPSVLPSIHLTGAASENTKA